LTITKFPDYPGQQEPKVYGNYIIVDPKGQLDLYPYASAYHHTLDNGSLPVTNTNRYHLHITSLNQYRYAIVCCNDPLGVTLHMIL